jgi:transcription antitermination factor NusG
MPPVWFAVQSKPNREDALSEQLRAREVEVYYPRIRVFPVNPRARKIKAYFPGYLFVHVDLAVTGISVLQFCPFAKGLVSFDNEPAEVSEMLIAAIRRKVDAVNAAGGEVFAALRPGDRVTIDSGPFAGYEAIFNEKLPGRERVKVLLLLLSGGRQVPLELNPGQITPIKK